MRSTAFGAECHGFCARRVRRELCGRCIYAERHGFRRVVLLFSERLARGLSKARVSGDARSDGCRSQVNLAQMFDKALEACVILGQRHGKAHEFLPSVIGTAFCNCVRLSRCRRTRVLCR